MRIIILLGGTLAVLTVSIGTMSLIRRILRRSRPSNRVGEEDSGSSEALNSLESILADAKRTMIESDSTPDESYNDATSPETAKQNVEYRRKRRKLNSILRRHSKKETKLNRKQREIIQIDAEIKEVMRMLSVIDIKGVALDEEVQFKRLEVMSHFPAVTEDDEKDIRRRESIYHKRYTGIKSAADAKSLLTMIRNRKYALEQLELLTYKRYVSVQHEIKIVNEKPPLPPLSPCRPITAQMLQTIRDRIVQQSLDGDFSDITSGSSGSPVSNGTLRLRMGHVPVQDSII